MSDQDRLQLDPSSEEWLLRVNGSKTHVVGLLLYTTLLWLLKGCWVVYYLRLTYDEPFPDIRTIRLIETVMGCPARDF
jgi:hypothetical protein